MTTRRNLLLSALLLIPVSLALGQRGGLNIADHLLIKHAEPLTHEAEREEYEGSPYLHEAFTAGSVTTENNTFTQLPMRYNIDRDLVEFEYNGRSYLLDPATFIRRVEIGEDVFVVRSLSSRSGDKSGFYELVEEGKLSLLSKKIVNYRKAQPLQGLPAKYSRQPDILYVQIGDQPVVKAGNVKNVIAALPDKQPDVTRFAKAGKLSSRKEDLIALVRYYNSLSDPDSKK